MMKKDTFISAKDVRLIDIVDKLPSFKRIALMTSDNQLTSTKIYNVEGFKQTDLYHFFKYDNVKYAAPEIQWAEVGEVQLPYLLVVLGDKTHEKRI